MLSIPLVLTPIAMAGYEGKYQGLSLFSTPTCIYMYIHVGVQGYNVHVLYTQCTCIYIVHTMYILYPNIADHVYTHTCKSADFAHAL